MAAQAERDQYLYLRSQTSSRVLKSCSEGIEHEVHDILGPLGTPEELSRRVAKALLKAEIDFSPFAHRSDEADGSLNPLNLRGSEDVGLTPFLLRLVGKQPVTKGRMYSSAATTA